MRRSFLAMMATMGILSGGFFLIGETGADVLAEDVAEEWVNANLLRVRVNGQWEDVPMVPLADHLCASQRSLFERYCGDDVVAPEYE